MKAQDYPSPPIYVDLDDVLCKTTRHFLALLEREYGKRILYEEILDFDWWKACGLGELELRALFRKAHEPDELLKLAPRQDAISVVRRWSRSGQKIVIVTGRPQSALEPTLAWLDRFAVSHDELVMVDKYGRYNDQGLSDFEGEAPRATPVEGATRADGTSEASIEGEAPRATPVEGATRADGTSEASIEGEAPRATPVEGATRAPLIVALSDLASRRFRFAVEDSPSVARFLAETLGVRVALLHRPWNRADPGSALVTRFLDWPSLGRAVADGSL